MAVAGGGGGGVGVLWHMAAAFPDQPANDLAALIDRRKQLKAQVRQASAQQRRAVLKVPLATLLDKFNGESTQTTIYGEVFCFYFNS